MKFSDTIDLAAWLRANAFSTHRGIARIASGQLVAFGNDRGNDIGEVDTFCESATAKGAHVIARGTDDSEHTWVVLVDADDGMLDELTDLLWSAWYNAKKVKPAPPEVESMKRSQNGRVPDLVAEVEWIA